MSSSPLSRFGFVAMGYDSLLFGLLCIVRFGLVNKSNVGHYSFQGGFWSFVVFSIYG